MPAVSEIYQLYPEPNLSISLLNFAVGILIGMDKDTGSPCIYKFDPAGWFTGNKVREGSTTFWNCILYKRKVPFC